MGRMPSQERRINKRHFLKLPIHYQEIAPGKAERSSPSILPERSQTKNLSDGGLLFLAPRHYPVDTLFELTFPVKDKLFTMKARVIHLTKDEDSGFYRTGVSFSSASQVFKIRMAEQLYEIDEYRNALSKEKGRSVSEEEAAEKWIGERSADFAEFYR